MKWIKKGLIFKPDNSYEWMMSHAQVPIADKLSDDVLRIYFGTRDKSNRTVTTYIEVEADNPQNILYIHDKPVLGLGELGCFDDSGAMPSWIVNHEEVKYLYYTGWNVSKTVSYRLSIGLAVSDDGGQTFRRIYAGPIMDRGPFEPYWCAQPCVLIENNKWKMWYLSCTKWEVINGQPEPFYLVKYAESMDGIHWKASEQVCIGYDPVTDAVGRPVVWVEDGIYKMLYSYRSATNYRIDPLQSYRLGYAESQDGIQWTRMDDRVGIERSTEGWDSEMIEYCYRYRHKDKIYLFYNGNGFGRSGVGYAVLDSDQ
jgi:hypothetical protein